MTKLTEKRCTPCEGGVPPLADTEITELLKQLLNWNIDSKRKVIERNFSFKNFHHTMAFVNAVAWIAHQENHHPDLVVGYNYCSIRYSTHAIDGLSENDFICAAKINTLIADTQEKVCILKS